MAVNGVPNPAPAPVVAPAAAPVVAPAAAPVAAPAAADPLLTKKLTDMIAPKLTTRSNSPDKIAMVNAMNEMRSALAQMSLLLGAMDVILADLKISSLAGNADPLDDLSQDLNAIKVNMSNAAAYFGRVDSSLNKVDASNFDAVQNQKFNQFKDLFGKLSSAFNTVAPAPRAPAPVPPPRPQSPAPALPQSGGGAPAGNNNSLVAAANALGQAPLHIPGPLPPIPIRNSSLPLGPAPLPPGPAPLPPGPAPLPPGPAPLPPVSTLLNPTDQPSTDTLVPGAANLVLPRSGIFADVPNPFAAAIPTAANAAPATNPAVAAAALGLSDPAIPIAVSPLVDGTPDPFAI